VRRIILNSLKMKPAKEAVEAEEMVEVALVI